MDAARTSESDVYSQRRWSGAAAAAAAPLTLGAGVAPEVALVAGVPASALRTLEELLLAVDAIVPSDVEAASPRADSAPSAPPAAAPLAEADEADLMLALPASDVAPSAGDEGTEGRRAPLDDTAGVAEEEDAEGAGGART